MQPSGWTQVAIGAGISIVSLVLPELAPTSIAKWTRVIQLSGGVIGGLLIAVPLLMHFRRGRRDADSPGIFYDDTDPNCYQTNGRVFVPVVGEPPLEHAETIYRLGVRSAQSIPGCMLTLEDVEPRPAQPGMQRIGMAMRPRIQAAGNPREFTINSGAPAYVEVLQEIIRTPNLMNEMARLRLIYAEGQLGQSHWFDPGDYVLTFRLEGAALAVPVRIRLTASFDRRRTRRTWVIGVVP